MLIPLRTAADAPPAPAQAQDSPVAATPAVELRTWLQPLLNTLTSVPAQAPFATDWPLPGPLNAGVTGFLWATQTQLLGQDVLPFYERQWPLPITTLPRVVDLLTWFQGLQGAGAQPFHQTKWPNPRGYPLPNEARTWLAALVALLPSGQPFQQTEWPNPGRYAIPDGVRNWLVSLVGQFPSDKPSVSMDWPNPRGATIPNDVRTWLQASVRAALAPNTQRDWPLPTPSRFAVEFRTWLNTLLPPQAVSRLPLSFRRPGLDEQWPTELRTWLAGRVAYYPPPTPGGQWDWPNPLGYVYPMDLRTLLQSLRPTVDPLIAQLDWPLPLPYGYALELRTWLLNLTQNAPPPVFPPFSVDLANPAALVLEVAILTDALNLLESTLGELVVDDNEAGGLTIIEMRRQQQLLRLRRRNALRLLGFTDRRDM